MTPAREADKIRRGGASAGVSDMQGGGFYLWASRSAAEAYVDDPWVVSKVDEGGTVILAFEVDPSDLEPDLVIGMPAIRSWAKSRGLPFPTIGHPRPSVVRDFVNGLTDRERDEMHAHVLRAALSRGGAVKYVGPERLYPVPDVTEAVYRRLLALTRPA